MGSGCHGWAFWRTAFAMSLLLVHGAISQSADERALQGMVLTLKGDGGLKWATSSGNSCTWVGVVCNQAKNVTMLNLAALDLKGSIPSAIDQFQALKTLNLSTNSLTGGIPTAIGNCGSLSVLALRGNKLSGAIPSSSLGHLTNLSILDLSKNSLNGTIPQGLGSLRSLKKLDLSANRLTGGFPSDLATLSSIQDFILSQNFLSGNIPDFVANLSTLITFSAYQNELEGEIPPQLGVQTSGLKLVNLASNSLVGNIPKNICRSRLLQELILTNNSLNGTLPEDLVSCTSLTNLRVDYNQLTGLIPQQIGQLNNLIYFAADSNKFSGEIPSNVSGWKSLLLLNLASNNLSGSIPRALIQVSSLQELYLSSNILSGEVPTGLYQYKSLSLLDLSKNHLSGRIPQDLCQTPILESLLLQENVISGPIPDTIGHCTKLLKLELGRNRLDGSIPSSIGNLSNLQISLNLSWNMFTGSIPSTLQRLTRLVSLDLSHNQLSGLIPSSLENMASLIAWDFSYNSLSGPVPKNGPFSKSKAVSFSNNTGLCGSPLAPCVSNSVGTVPEDSSKKRGLAFWKAAGITAACSLALLTIIVGLMVKRMYKHETSPVVDPTASLMVNRVFAESYQQAINFESIKEAIHRTDNVVTRNHFSTIYKVVMPSGVVFAAKKLHSAEKGLAVYQRRMIFELDKLVKISHENVMRPAGYVLQDDLAVILYDFVPICSLQQQLHQNSVSVLDWSTRFAIALRAAQGLAFLHHTCHPPVIHMDVTSNNIFLGSNLEVKLGDVEVTKLLDPSKHTGSISAVAGSFGYIAPEYAFTMQITMATNVYSFGVVLLELVTGRPPVDESFGDGVDLVKWVHGTQSRNETPEQILDKRISTVSFPSRQEMLAVLMVALLCTNATSSRRPRMKKVVEMLVDAKHLAMVE